MISATISIAQELESLFFRNGFEKLAYPTITIDFHRLKTGNDKRQNRSTFGSPILV